MKLTLNKRTSKSRDVSRLLRKIENQRFDTSCWLVADLLRIVVKTKEKDWDLLKVMKKSLEITKLAKSISNDEVLMSFDLEFSSSTIN